MGSGQQSPPPQPTTCPFYHCPPTDADSPLCGIPAPQGISSLTSGNGNEKSDLCPCPSKPAALLTLNALLVPPQLCPGHVGSWQDSSAPSCALALLARGCANGESCGRGYLVVILESTSATQAKMVRPEISHPSCLRCHSGPDPAFSPSAPSAALLL